jgi:hypothetical protein
LRIWLTQAAEPACCLHALFERHKPTICATANCSPAVNSTPRIVLGFCAISNADDTEANSQDEYKEVHGRLLVALYYKCLPSRFGAVVYQLNLTTESKPQSSTRIMKNVERKDCACGRNHSRRNLPDIGSDKASSRYPCSTVYLLHGPSRCWWWLHGVWWSGLQWRLLRISPLCTTR